MTYLPSNGFHPPSITGSMPSLDVFSKPHTRRTLAAYPSVMSPTLPTEDGLPYSDQVLDGSSNR